MDLTGLASKHLSAGLHSFLEALGQIHFPFFYPLEAIYFLVHNAWIAQGVSLKDDSAHLRGLPPINHSNQ